jgi:hypothetical protein
VATFAFVMVCCLLLATHFVFHLNVLLTVQSFMRVKYELFAFFSSDKTSFLSPLRSILRLFKSQLCTGVRICGHTVKLLTNETNVNLKRYRDKGKYKNARVNKKKISGRL